MQLAKQLDLPYCVIPSLKLFFFGMISIYIVVLSYILGLFYISFQVKSVKSSVYFRKKYTDIPTNNQIRPCATLLSFPSTYTVIINGKGSNSLANNERYKFSSSVITLMVKQKTKQKNNNGSDQVQEAASAFVIILTIFSILWKTGSRKCEGGREDTGGNSSVKG